MMAQPQIILRYLICLTQECRMRVLESLYGKVQEVWGRTYVQ